MDQPRGHRREALVAMCPTPWLKGHTSLWVAVARPHLRRWRDSEELRLRLRPSA